MKLTAPGSEKFVEEMDRECALIVEVAQRDFEAMSPERQAAFLRGHQAVQDRMNAEGGLPYERQN